MTTDIETLGRAIKIAQYYDHRALNAALAEVGVSLPQWDALRAIDRLPAGSAHDLAMATFQSDQAFGTLATRLVVMGLITRAAGQGRRIEHALTEAGQNALDAGRIAARETWETVFAPLDERQRADLLDLLTLLNEGRT
jgi:DNA-binding MarR family transcriptional regulator